METPYCICQNCFFLQTYPKGQKYVMGTLCHRFPAAIPKSPSSWCGEWRNQPPEEMARAQSLIDEHNLVKS